MLHAAALVVALDLTAYAGEGRALAAAVVHDGRIVAAETHGAPPGAAFRMASISKVVTAIAVVQLADERRLDLHADIDRYLRDLPIRRFRGKSVTLHHLLTHTSGIEDAVFGNTVPLTAGVPTLDQHFRRRPPVFGRAPGAQVVYSNEGMALAGYITERVSGLRFPEYVRRRIFEPLGMQSSTFEQPPRVPVVLSGAEGEALVQAPAGAMVSTAADMARLMIALLDGRIGRMPYGLFANEIGGKPGLFHTGRSGHESVFYLVPQERTGVFLVHTGGMDRRLRRRYVETIVGTGTLGPKPTPLRSGTYRPILFPVTRIERVTELGSDASLVVHGDTADLTLPPLAVGRKLRFRRGITADGYRLAGAGDRVVLTGPLFEPVTFVRVPWWASGRTHLVVGLLGFVVIATAVFRARGAARIVFLLVIVFTVAAPLAFLANYLPRDAATRPFHVEGSLRAACTLLLLASIAAMVTPVAAWRARTARLHCAFGSGSSWVLVIGMHHYNLLGYRF